MLKHREKLLSALGLDFHVVVTLLMRGWSILAGAVMVVIIPKTLSAHHQGYYFTFLSLLGLQIFFELGLNQVVTQFISKELALSEKDDGSKHRHFARISAALRMLHKWYVLAAILFFVLTASVGAYLFNREASIGTEEWLGPWLLLTACTAVNLYFSPLLAATEGCGMVGQVSRLRMIQGMVGSVVCWLMLLGGLALWAIPAQALVMAISTPYWLNASQHVLKKFQAHAGPTDLNWFKEIFPFQWRLALSWMSGYLMYQLFTPMMFARVGAEAAGKLGLTLTIFNAIQSLGVAWFNARMPAITERLHKATAEESATYFKHTFFRAVGLTLAIALIVSACLYLTGRMGLGLNERLVDLPTVTLIAIGAIANTAIYGAATYMRAHGVEPMLTVSVVAAIATLACVYTLAPKGVFPTMAGQVTITLLLVTPWTYRLLKGYLK